MLSYRDEHNLTKDNFDIFTSNVQISKKSSIHLHTLGNNMNSILNYVLNEGNLPIIPKIYFDKGKSKDLFGQVIINKYYKINYFFNRLMKTKTYILSILKGMKYELENYKEVSKKKYNILKNGLLLKIKSSITETFNNQEEFIKFKRLYCKNSFNIFKGFNEIIPLFRYIFEHTYIGKAKHKNYFNKLFKKYIENRVVLTQHIKNNFGLLAFKSIFDIDNIKINQIEQSKNKRDPINYNKYVVYNESDLPDSKSKQKKSAPTKSTISKKMELNEKINEFNLMYLSAFDPDYYIKEHSIRLERINNDIKTNIDKLLGGYDIMNLYDIMVLTLNLDFSIIELMFYYCDHELFQSAMKNHDQIKQYIFNKLSTLDMYYDLYKDWLYHGEPYKNHSKKSERLIKYKHFFDDILKVMCSNVSAKINIDNSTRSNNFDENSIKLLTSVLFKQNLLKHSSEFDGYTLKKIMNNMDLEEKLLGLKNKVSKSKSESKNKSKSKNKRTTLNNSKDKSKSKKVSFNDSLNNVVHNRDIDSYVEKLKHMFNIKGGNSHNNELVVDEDTTNILKQVTICDMIKLKYPRDAKCSIDPNKENPLIELDYFNDLVVYYTSGDYNNCLLHSFFMVTSEAYRNLSNNNKNKFINQYRKYLINNEEGIRFNKDDLHDIRGDGFLEDTVGRVLGEYFGICILFITIQKQGESHVLDIQIYDNTKTKNQVNVYIIFNSGNRHFSGVGFILEPDNVPVFNISKREALHVMNTFAPNRTVNLKL